MSNFSREVVRRDVTPKTYPRFSSMRDRSQGPPLAPPVILHGITMSFDKKLCFRVLPSQ